ncbi:MAG: lytic transglycosylase domain-containing protein [Myxococcota bacterium]|nr:lytic transglycosylase domain-containing protein [Myxococcota bacterium]MDW8362870.1 transglycosylase SLT domain-containing protein [Myxococcales bacterium]
MQRFVGCALRRSRGVGVVCMPLAVGASIVVVGRWPAGHAQPSAASTDVARFDPVVVVPEPGSLLDRARTALERGAREDVRTMLRELPQDADARTRGELQWLRALVTEQAVAAEAWEALATTDHVLAPWAALRAAEAWLDRDPRRALSVLAPHRDGWAGAARARRLEARAALRLGELDRARALLQRADTESTANDWLELADALERSGARVERVLDALRAAIEREPLSAQARRAAERVARLVERLDPVARAAASVEPLSTSWRRADALFDAMRHAEAEQAYLGIAERAELDPPGRCRALTRAAQAVARRRERDRAARLFESALPVCVEPDARATVRWHRARALLGAGAVREAVAELDALATELPQHRLGDDARVLAARALIGVGETGPAVERLRAALADHPTGDMRGEARFLLAWKARGDGDHGAALAELDASLAEGPSETAEGLRGRAAYWRARLLLELGRRDEALAGLEALCAQAPLSYYARQAVARLDELAPARAQAVRDSWRAGGWRLSFPWRPELEAPPWVRALSLWRVGANAEARRELEELGAFGEGADPAMSWLVAAVFERAGQHAAAVRLVRRRLPVLGTLAPATAAGYWRVGYPRAFSPLVEQIAAREGVDVALLRAVAREESGFVVDAVSPARARGLVQLLESTARRHAAGLPTDPRALLRPDVNLAVGARYLRALAARYGERYGVVPAAYNAGERAVDGWLRRRPGATLDAWIEEIPYEETRLYTRRVLQSWTVYAWLDAGTLPPLPAELPSPP